MNDVVQLDLFDIKGPKPLNGMYYEKRTNKFVSYVRGRRHFEVTPSRCLGDEAWKERIKKERGI
ncbi:MULTISPECIES: hypothetical protein [Paenibacillus]|uniref:Uncharacterized protein n=1 Tax=Paenibacillus polymyxa TaxID=1406 RepID=A0ABX2Z8P9_PAEPO|nr:MULTISPECIES: hypothetical protein [Paenibacillus]ODA07334.1 hypothetical protein A7312_09585 [Paenibacillus polymyxa]OME69647.1 hypothetical protein BK119_14355 [Paenibacillus peoriae]